MKWGRSTIVIFVFLFSLSCQPRPPLPKLGLPDIDENGIKSIHKVNDFTFTDQNGKSYSWHKDNGQLLVMNYFFTSCLTICPMMTDNVRDVFLQFKNESVQFVSASVDPIRDQPGRLKRFMESHKLKIDQNWHFLTGDKKALYTFARYQLFLSALEEVDKIENDFIHSEKVVLIDQHGHIRGYYRGTDKDNMKQLAKDIDWLLHRKEGDD